MLLVVANTFYSKLTITSTATSTFWTFYFYVIVLICNFNLFKWNCWLMIEVRCINKVYSKLNKTMYKLFIVI